LGEEGKEMRITTSVDISCKPNDVFPWIAEPKKAMLWQKGVKGGTILIETPERIGTTFMEIMEENGSSLKMFGVITGYIQNKLIAFHIKSKIHELHVSYSIEGDNNQSTITVESTIIWKFPMNIMSTIIGRKMKESILKQTEAEFAELVKLCESKHAS
jgi:hypothetical protein